MKKIIILALLLFLTSAVMGKSVFSLSLENSLLTGTMILKSEKPKDYDFYDKIKGGQSLLVLRYQINDCFSVGLGSGTSINKLNDYDFWIEVNHYGDDSITSKNVSVNYSPAMFYIPIFAEVRGAYPLYNDLLYVYISAKTGGSTAPIEPENVKFIIRKDIFAGGLFVEPMFGVYLNRKKFLLDAGVGYHLQKSKHTIYRYDSDLNIFDKRNYLFDLNQLVVKLGFGFFFGEK